MDTNLSQFHQIFFDDSFESIDNVEQILIKLDASNANNEIIENIFRCAHSIKGSSSMFGFDIITQFSHIMESYLELVRTNEILLNQESIELLLKCFDCLRGMINNIKNNQPSNEDEIKRLEEQLTTLIQNKGSPGAKDKNKKSKPIDAPKTSTGGWIIYFKPHVKIFQNGDDPLRILRALNELGTVSCDVNAEDLLALDDFYPNECYLSWNITLSTNKTEQHIRQFAFEWVEDESEIRFSPIKASFLQESITEHQSIEGNSSKMKDLTSIRVNTDKIDELINMVGELVITQSMLAQVTSNFEETKLHALKEGVSQLEQICRELQENVMRIRMLPISNVFNRFPRLVRDLCKASGKEVELKLSGENTELDKTVLEKIIDPLVHLVRNALDHGIESPDERKNSHKNEIGLLHLNSFHQGSNIIIQVSDDGKGLNHEKILKKALENKLITTDKISEEQINELIFIAGFSTAETVTELSGRGVGMDVVRNNIESLGGRVDVKSTLGKGTTFTISLPLTLAIIDGQLVRIGQSIYIIPLISMIETIQINSKNISSLSPQMQVYILRGEYVPIIRLHELFNIEVNTSQIEDHLLVIVELNKQLYGIMIDELLQLHQIVIKNIESNYNHIEGISAATILGDGTVAFILDIAGIIRMATQRYLPKDIHLTAHKKTVA